MESLSNLLDFSPAGLTAWFAERGEKAFRARQVLRWMHREQCADFATMTDVAKSLRERLEKEACIRVPEVVSSRISADGTRKWLLDVGNKNAIETVYIPEATRGTLCISSQAGCALDCAFCATGKQGFNRNLSTAEIIAQLWFANRELRQSTERERAVSNVVMMGMGEPLTNYDNVLRALQIMLDDHAYGLSRRRVTVSTSGIVPAMDRLAADCPVALAVSLHAPNDALRDELVPINKKYPLAMLLDACNRYLRTAPRDFITFEYVMLDGVNDLPEHARALVKLAKQVPCKYNLIPFNPFAGSTFKRSPYNQISRFLHILQDAGVVTTVRKTRGDDVDAACGQLAGQVQDRSQRVVSRWVQKPVVED